MVAEIALHLEVQGPKSKPYSLLSCSLRPNFWCMDSSLRVGDVPDHAGQRQAARGRALAVVVAAVPVRIGGDGPAPHLVEGDLLGRGVGAGGDGHGQANHVRVRDGPLQDLHPAKGAADHGEELVDAEMLEEPLLHVHHVLDGDHGKVEPVGLSCFGIYGGGAGRALAAAKNVGADHEVLVRVQGLARPDDDVPPAGLLLALVPACGMGVAGEGVADQHGIALLLVQLAVGLVGDIDLVSRSPCSREISSGNSAALGLDRGPRILSSLHRPGQSLIEICDDIFYILDADGEPDEVGRHAGGRLLLGVSCWWVVDAGG